MFSSNKRTLIMVAPLLLLSACGEGWEAQKTDEIFPYGNERTAGSGVVYVRAQMMPEKELKLEPVAEMPKEEVAPVEKAEPVAKPVLDAEEIFEDAQEKGSFSNKKRTMKAAEVAPVEEGQAEKLMKAEMTEQKVSDVPAYAEEASQDVLDDVADAEIAAEQPKDIETPDVAVKDAPSEHEPVVAEAASEVEQVAEKVVEDVAAVSPQPVAEAVEQDVVVEADAEDSIVADPSEGSTVDAVVDAGSVDENVATEKDQGWSDQIVAPKKDFIGYVPEGGEAVLSEIYSDGF